MSNKTYYISNGGNKIGPLSSQDIMGYLKSGRLNYFDMIFNAQQNEWVMLMQHPDFADSSDEVRESETDASITVGLLSEGEFKTLELEVGEPAKAEPLESLGWYLPNQPRQSYSFLEILALIEKGQLAEKSQLARSPQGPWRPLDKWEEFSLESIEQLKGNTNADVPSIHLRRSQQRVPVKKYFLVYFKGSLTQEFCLEISFSGMSLFCKTEQYKMGDALTLRFDTEFDEAFDAEGKVVSMRKVRVGNRSETFIRYGVSFSKISPRGRALVEALLAKYP